LLGVVTGADVEGSADDGAGPAVARDQDVVQQVCRLLTDDRLDPVEALPDRGGRRAWVVEQNRVQRRQVLFGAAPWIGRPSSDPTRRPRLRCARAGRERRRRARRSGRTDSVSAPSAEVVPGASASLGRGAP
jgi:hypothetical protein